MKLAILISLVLILALAGVLSKTKYVIEVKNEVLEAGIRVAATISHYSSDPSQTDDSPLITASNKQVYEGLIANNCWSFGTEVEINGKRYTVDDRMNRRYGCEYFDIWMDSADKAILAGKFQEEVRVLIK